MAYAVVGDAVRTLLPQCLRELLPRRIVVFMVNEWVSLLPPAQIVQLAGEHDADWLKSVDAFQFNPPCRSTGARCTWVTAERGEESDDDVVTIFAPGSSLGGAGRREAETCSVTPCRRDGSQSIIPLSQLSQVLAARRS